MNYRSLAGSLALGENPNLWSITAVFISTFLALWGFRSLLRKSRGSSYLPLPPGPKPHPIIGNLLQIPAEEPWKIYEEWAKEYGNIMYFEALGQRVLVLNSLPVVHDLLVKRASNYSDRVWSPLIDLLQLHWSFASMNYGNKWRDYRRWFSRFFHHAKVHQYHPIIEQEVTVFLRALLSNPGKFRKETTYLFGNILMRASYGMQDPEYNKNLVEPAAMVVNAFMEYSVPGRLLVNSLPVLRFVPSWFPGAGWKAVLENLARMGERATTQPFKDVQEKMRNGEATGDYGNVAAGLLDSLPEKNDPNYHYQEEAVKHVCAMAYTGGIDPTVSSGRALFLALAMYPEAQRKAQAELDAAVGVDRLPNFGDLEHLPYLQALVKELNRWHTVIPLSVPRVTREEDVYNGYRIPAQTMILTNAWAIMHDPEIFEDPMAFKPERYLKDGKIDLSVLDPEAAAFGFGRRICPGRHLSNDALALMSALLLSCFDIKPALDENGKPVPLKHEVDPTSLVTFPLPFECSIIPRSPERVELLQKDTM